jgi:hypothetical protein
MYSQIDMDFKQTTKEEQKQQQGEIYNHLLNIQHYMNLQATATSSWKWMGKPNRHNG